MVHTKEFLATRELFLGSCITDEYLLRELALNLIQQISFDELNKLMKFTKTDPTTNINQNKMYDTKTNENERIMLMRLQKEHLIKYEAKLILP